MAPIDFLGKSAAPLVSVHSRASAISVCPAKGPDKGCFPGEDEGKGVLLIEFPSSPDFLIRNRLISTVYRVGCN